MMSEMSGYVSIIVPAYNEEHALGGVLVQLRKIRECLEKEGHSLEIIVIDDGSIDRTAEVASQYPDITLIRHRVNRGYGAALKTGIRHAKGDVICITDADGTYPTMRIPELVQRLVGGEYDMVVGARIGERVAIPLARRPAKWAIRQLAGFVAGEAIPDLNSGMRVFKRRAVLRFLGILPDGFSFTTTITLGMLTNAYLVDYVPVDYHARIGRSKIRPIRDTLNFVQLVTRIALYFKPLKVFVPLSMFLFVMGIIWALFTMFVLGRLADVSVLIIGMAAIQVFVVGMLAELINQRLPNVYDKE